MSTFFFFIIVLGPSPMLVRAYSAAHLEAESQVSGLGPGFPFGNFYIWQLVKQKKTHDDPCQNVFTEKPTVC